MPTTYKIGNPRGIPEGLQILTWPCTIPDPKNPEKRIPRGSMKKDKLWYEGDDFVPPAGLNIDRLLSSGHIYEPEIAEVNDGS